MYVNGTLKKTTQFAVQDSLATTVNGSTGYNRAYPYSNSTDQVFSDGFSTQLLTVTGSNTAGYVATGLDVISYVGLPLKLTSFTADIIGEGVKLSWVSENEVDVKGFDVERATDGMNFSKVGSVAAYNTSGTNRYSFNDGTQAGVVYYRLKMGDLNGSFEYSSIVVVNGPLFKHVKAYPNPTKSNITINHPKADDNTWVRLMNVAGMVVSQSRLPAGVSITNFDLSAFPTGTYLLVIQTKNQREAIKLYKQ